MRGYWVACAVLFGCSGGSTGGSSSQASTADGGQPAPTVQGKLDACNKEDRHGSYLVTYKTMDGTCPDQISHVANFSTAEAAADKDGGAQDGCVVESSEWTENDCNYQSAVTCIKSGAKITIGGFVRQVAQDGSRLEGIQTMTYDDGYSSCAGTFKVVYARQ